MRKAMVLMMALVMGFIVGQNNNEALGANEEITITEAYTMNYCGDEFDVFGIWDPIWFYVKCEVSGDPAKTYKVVIVVRPRSLGEKIVKKYKKVSDGDTIIFQYFRVIDDDVELDAHTVDFIAKLKKKGGLVHKPDPVSYDVTVQAERPEFTCYPYPPPEPE